MVKDNEEVSGMSAVSEYPGTENEEEADVGKVSAVAVDSGYPPPEQSLQVQRAWSLQTWLLWSLGVKSAVDRDRGIIQHSPPLSSTYAAATQLLPIWAHNAAHCAVDPWKG